MEILNRKLIQLLAGVVLAAAITALPAGSARPVPQTSAPAATAMDKPFVVEYYYKAKWGHADEFIALFKKNHYPVLKKNIGLGRMLKVSAVTPRYHSTEDGRWDYRVTIVYKNAAIAHDEFDSTSLLKQLFPDQETFKREEQRRFEILDAHWDVPVKDLDLDAR
ncbi:MAG: hypothetical protein PVS2B2_19390 [Candidatus Acidiferrum sp.]